MTQTNFPSPLAPPRPSYLRTYVFATEHKIVGLQFLFVSLFFFCAAGLLAMLMRWQLAFPSDPTHPLPLLSLFSSLRGSDLLDSHGGMRPDFYNVILTLHATLMVFFVIIPLLNSAFGTYLIPLKIGAPDMAMPLLSGLSFWLALPAGAILVSGLCLGGSPAAAGWTSYPPLSIIASGGTSAPPWPLLPRLMVGLAFVGLWIFIAKTAMRLNTWLALPFVLVGVVASVLLTQRIAVDGQGCWFLSLILLSFSSVSLAINYITTILTCRCPGMTMLRLPLTVWSLLITALVILLATPVLSADMLLALLDHHGLSSFFEPGGWTLSGQIQSNAGGGQPLIYLHLFWFYGHPSVYIMMLPAMGIISDILPVFCRKPLFGYRAMIATTAAIALLGFAAWGHHMFQTGMNPALGTAFTVSTMLIAAPSGIKTFNWLGTLWHGRIRLELPMLNALAFISLFVIGGMSGIFMASTAADVPIHMTYFIVAHLHYVLFGGSTFGIFAAIYFWYPKMFGRLLSRRLGLLHFGLSFIAFNCTFFPMHYLGLQGMPRRIADPTNYFSLRHLQPVNVFISFSAFALGLAQVPLVVNFIGSWFWGQKAPANPWQATTLEWNDAASPPAPGNFAAVPVVLRGPYEYGRTDRAEDWLAQTKVVE